MENNTPSDVKTFMACTVTTCGKCSREMCFLHNACPHEKNLVAAEAENEEN